MFDIEYIDSELLIMYCTPSGGGIAILIAEKLPVNFIYMLNNDLLSSIIVQTGISINRVYASTIVISNI